MSVNAPNLYVEEFTSNVAHLLQRMGGKYRGKVTEGSYRSNGGVVVDQFAAVEAQEVNTRYEPMPRTDWTTERVWIYPRDYDIPGLMVAPADVVRMMTDPRSPVAEAAAKGMSRKIDDILSDAFYAAMTKGTNGGSTETFDTTNHRVDAAVGAAADTGMNVEKILEARKLLLEGEVDLDNEVCYLALTPEQEHDLLKQEQVLSADKKGSLGIRTDERGRIIGLAGCDVVVTTKVPSNSSYRLNPLWVRSGMHLGIWREVGVRVGERHDVRDVPWQLYPSMTMAATRVEAGRVIQIECTEA